MLCWNRSALWISSTNRSLNVWWFNKSERPSWVAFLYIFSYSINQCKVAPRTRPIISRSLASRSENGLSVNLSNKMDPRLSFSINRGTPNTDWKPISSFSLAWNRTILAWESFHWDVLTVSPLTIGRPCNEPFVGNSVPFSNASFSPSVNLMTELRPISIFEEIVNLS